jgi:hypothetical protein
MQFIIASACPTHWPSPLERASGPALVTLRLARSSQHLSYSASLLATDFPAGSGVTTRLK